MQKWQIELNQTLREVQGQKSSAPSAIKTVYVVRHAESESNVAKKNNNVVRVIQAGFNAPLSEEGRRQLLAVRPATQDIRNELQGILVSPLQRAKETALVLFGDMEKYKSTATHVAESLEPPSEKIFWHEVRAMKEIRPKEHAQKLLCSQSILQRRVRSFMSFLARLPWDSFALVGHSKFFRTMFEFMDVKMVFENAVVWKVMLHSGDSGLSCISQERIARPLHLTDGSVVNESTATNAQEIEMSQGAL